MAGAELAGSDPYRQGKPCPKCAYVRTPTDVNPAWQCPKCRIAYAKYHSGTAKIGARLVASARELAAEARADHSVFALIAANLMALLFAANHSNSLLQNVRRDALGKPNLGTLMLLPYARIVPMHLTIVFGGLFFGGAWAFALFGFLKTVADAVMHTVEHHVLASGSAALASPGPRRAVH